MSLRGKSYSTIFVLVIAASMISMRGDDAARAANPRVDDYTQPFFRHLTKLRIERKNQIIDYFDSVRKLADEMADDSFILEAFWSMIEEDSVSKMIIDSDQLDTHFVTHYSEFYDILFINRAGFVFHSIRQESDYQSNLFDGFLSESLLAKRLPGITSVSFIDYRLYSPSKEPGAFFVVPVFEDDMTKSGNEKKDVVGWFVLQCPINKLNAILGDRRNLGRTGETYLVNTDQMMVTNSRFQPDPVDAKLKVETAAIETALGLGHGERVLEDYRGIRVLSSFERFDVFGTTWVIAAEIDEDEAITEHYKSHKTYFQDKLAGRAGIKSDSVKNGEMTVSPKIRVDMNEYQRALPGSLLTTKGVATCTAVSVTLPGHVGYLAHIGPSDRIYGKHDRGHNDSLGDMIQQISHYDVYPYQLPGLELTIIASHLDSVTGAVDRLLELGIETSQIRFAFNPKASLANVTLDPRKGTTFIEWILSDGTAHYSNALDFDRLGDTIRTKVQEAARQRKVGGPS